MGATGGCEAVSSSIAGQIRLADLGAGRTTQDLAGTGHDNGRVGLVGVVWQGICLVKDCRVSVN
jgi:hypothetical protein